MRAAHTRADNRVERGGKLRDIRTLVRTLAFDFHAKLLELCFKISWSSKLTHGLSRANRVAMILNHVLRNFLEETKLFFFRFARPETVILLFFCSYVMTILPKHLVLGYFFERLIEVLLVEPFIVENL